MMSPCSSRLPVIALLLGITAVVALSNVLSKDTAREMSVGQVASNPSPSITPAVDDSQDAQSRPTEPDVSGLSSPSPAAASLPPHEPTPAIICRPWCLIRISWTGSSSVERWIARGLQPLYEAEDDLWAAVPPVVIAELQQDRHQISVIADEAYTLPLYVIRLPDDANYQALLGGLGQIIDRVSNHLLIRATILPPRVDEIIAAGLWIEKMPPVAVKAAVIDQKTLLGEPAAIGERVSANELKATIAALQDMGDALDAPRGRTYTEPGNVAAAEYIYERFAEAGLRVWYEDFVTDNGQLGINIVGEVPGRDRSRMLLVVAHYDSQSDDDEAPGADDNASGVAAIIEIARLLAGYDLPYPVRLVALTAEEAGLQGAEAFAGRAAAEGVAYIAAFNLDAIGAPLRDHALLLNADAGTVWLLDTLVAVNDDGGLGQQLVVRQNPAIVADDTVLREWGIPAILITRAVVGENPVHHTSRDTLANLDLHGVEEATRLTLLALAQLLSETGDDGGH
jgi:hypothetical protein